MGSLTLRAFGQLQLEQDGNLITDRLPVKGRALLVYLAVNDQAQSREALAGLLWSEMPDDSARTNLRVMLSKLRKVVGDYLAISREMVGLVEGVWVDVAEFEKLAGDTAVSLYTGDFLADFYVPDAPLFDEWVLIERERLRQIIINLLHKLVQQALTIPELTDKGIAYARRILALDEWREEAHRQLMMLLARSGQRSAALAQFEQCRHILAEALGVAPSAATVALYEEIKVEGRHLADEKQRRLQPTPRLIPHNLPAQTTPFIGRDEESAQIEELMAQAECHLLTLVGPGGMGKTRLALQVAQQQLAAGSFGDGVFFVSLTAVTTPDFLITTIAQALNFSFSGQVSPKEQLLNYLREKQVLLVLDNFEQIATEVDLLTDILQTASGVKLLVTSRVQLNLYEEWLLEVSGLAVPEMDAADWEEASSVQMFQQRARRTFLAFNLQADKTAVIQICHLVAGMPLGLELAAAWVRALSCAEIAKEISRNLDFLATTTQNLPERHRSLRATFDYSWQLLPAPEQAVLPRLTIFRGSFTRAAAAVVADASLRSLSLLVDKSFVRRGTDGRYYIHESLRQFAEERLDERMAVQQKHAQFFADFIHLGVDEVLSHLEMTAVLADIDNVRLAWETAVSHQNTDLIACMLEGLYRFYMTRGWHQEGMIQFKQASAQLADTPSARPLLGKLWLRQGYCGQLISREVEIPQQLYQQGLAVAQQLGDKEEEALAVSGLGFVEIMRSQYTAAEELLSESIIICRELKLQRLLGNSLNFLASCLLRQGAFDRAKAACEEALQVRRAIKDESGIASSLTNLGSLLCTLGEFLEARTVYEEALQLCRQLDHKVGIAGALAGLFQAAFYLRDKDKAAAYIGESLAVYREAGDRWGMAIALHNLGYLAADWQEYEEAKAHFTQAIALYRQIGIKSSLANTLKSLGVTCLALADGETAVTHFHEALQLTITSNVPYITAEVLLEIALMWLQTGHKARAAVVLKVVRDAPEARERFRKQAEETLNSLDVEDLDEEEVDWEERPLTEVAPLVLQRLSDSANAQ